MISFWNFETVANEACIIYLKRRQFVGNLRKSKLRTKERGERK